MIDLRRRTTYFFLLVSRGHVRLISAQVQSKSGTPVLTHLTFGAFAGGQRAAAWATDGVGGIWGRYLALRGVEAENAALKEQLVVLQGQVQAQAAIASRTASLESALQLQPTLPQRTLIARVIAGDPAPGARVVTIDRGAADGVTAEMGVIAVGGVVGRIMGQPAEHAAQEPEGVLGRSGRGGDDGIGGGHGADGRHPKGRGEGRQAVSSALKRLEG